VDQIKPTICRRAVALVAASVLSGGILSVAGASIATASPRQPTAHADSAGSTTPDVRKVVTHRIKQVKVGAASDTFVTYRHPMFHAGSLHRLAAVDGRQHRKVVYVKFRVGALPAHAVIKHAVLRLTRKRHHMPRTTLRLYRVRSTHWTQAHLDARNRPRPDRRLATRQVARRFRNVSLPVHHLNLHAHHTYSFAVTSSDRHRVTRFKSRESGTGPNLSLTIKVPVRISKPVGPGQGQDPTPTPIPTVVPTVVPTPTPTPTPTHTARPTPTPTPTHTATPTPTPTPSSGCKLSAILVPSCGVMLGGYLTSFGHTTTASALDNFNSQSGSNVSVSHDYRTPGQVLSSGDVQVAQMPNTLLLLNWKPAASWASADGSDASVNSQIDAMANSIKALGSTKILLTVFHEPENDVSGGASGCPSSVYKGGVGTPAQYRAMWANVEARFAALNVTNVVWTMNYMGFSGWKCMIDDLWPGNSLVDWILWDPYSSDKLNFSQTVSIFYNELTSMSDATHDYLSKPWGLGEFGDRATTDANQENFYTTVAQSLNNNEFPKLKLLTFFDNVGTTGDYRVAYDQGSWDPKELADLRVLSQDPSIQGGRDSIAGG
jgi:hypothetical protein